MEFRDRISTYPGRVILKPVAGQSNTYDMVRADEPTEPGTPVNKALFDTVGNEMAALRQHVADTLFALSQRVEVGSLANGSVFGLYENGVLTPFVKLVNNYESSGRVLVVRKDCVKSSVLDTPSRDEYANSEIDFWLNNEYPVVFDAATRGVLSTANIKVATNTGVAGIARQVFLLSLYEYRLSSDIVANMGNQLSYFNTAERRIATLDGTPVNHWTRSGVIYSPETAYITPEGGHAIGNPGTFIAGIRPALTLPTGFVVTAGVPNTANTMATAEVI